MSKSGPGSETPLSFIDLFHKTLSLHADKPALS
jgi:hypothetical protein